MSFFLADVRKFRTQMLAEKKFSEHLREIINI